MRGPLKWIIFLLGLALIVYLAHLGLTKVVAPSKLGHPLPDSVQTTDLRPDEK